MANSGDPDVAARIELVCAYLEALQRQDPEALCALVTEDFVLEVPLSPSGNNDSGDAMAWRGIEDFRANYAEHFPTILTSQKLTDVAIRPTVEPGFVYAEAFGDMTLANGKPYKNRYVFRFRIRDRKICELLEFANPVTGAIAFGLELPATGSDT